MATVLGKLGLANTTAGLVIVHVIYGMAFTTLFFRNFYISIPDELVKAAKLDGAGFFTIFFKILLPISTPIIMVTVIGSSPQSGMTSYLASFIQVQRLSQLRWHSTTWSTPVLG